MPSATSLRIPESSQKYSHANTLHRVRRVLQSIPRASRKVEGLAVNVFSGYQHPNQKNIATSMGFWQMLSTDLVALQMDGMRALGRLHQEAMRQCAGQVLVASHRLGQLDFGV